MTIYNFLARIFGSTTNQPGDGIRDYCNKTLDLFKEDLFQDKYIPWIQEQIISGHQCAPYFLDAAQKSSSTPTSIFLAIREAQAKVFIEKNLQDSTISWRYDSFLSAGAGERAERLLQDAYKVSIINKSAPFKYREAIAKFDSNTDVLIAKKNCEWIKSVDSNVWSKLFQNHALEKFSSAGIDCDAPNVKAVVGEVSDI